MLVLSMQQEKLWESYQKYWKGLGFEGTPIKRTSFLTTAKPENVVNESAEQCACDRCGSGRRKWMIIQGIAKFIFHNNRGAGNQNKAGSDEESEEESDGESEEESEEEEEKNEGEDMEESDQESEGEDEEEDEEEESWTDFRTFRIKQGDPFIAHLEGSIFKAVRDDKHSVPHSLRCLFSKEAVKKLPKCQICDNFPRMVRVLCRLLSKINTPVSLEKWTQSNYHLKDVAFSPSLESQKDALKAALLSAKEGVLEWMAHRWRGAWQQRASDKRGDWIKYDPENGAFVVDYQSTQRLVNALVKTQSEFLSRDHCLNLGVYIRWKSTEIEDVVEVFEHYHKDDTSHDVTTNIGILKKVGEDAAKKGKQTCYKTIFFLLF